MLTTAIALHLALQAGPPPQGRQTIVRDSTQAGDTTGAARRTARRLPVTAAVLASAFRDSATRELFNRARTARLTQDSTLKSYDAKVRQRLSVNVGIGKNGPERLVFRQEGAARVQWQRGTGVRVDVTGARVAIPPVGNQSDERDNAQGLATDNDLIPIPYFPGSETLWVGDLTAQSEVNDLSLVNPLAGGAEAYYTYEAGDSFSMRLPDGRTIQVRELKVRPRVAKPNLAVGSLWVDVSKGNLVRAAYRLAVPASMTIGVESPNGQSRSASTVSFLMRTMVSPMTAQLSAVVVEYGLYESQFWLPRSQSMEGSAQAMFARVPVRMDNAFNYASVNADLALSEIHVDTTRRDRPRLERLPAGLDSAARVRWRDSTRAVYDAAMKARRDSIAAGLKVGSMRQCESSDTRIITRYRTEARIPFEVRVPCDTDKLINSADLPASIYDPGEAVFTSIADNPMVAAALAMGAQAPLSLGDLPAPRFQLGPSMTRYNRVEGLSTGLLIEQQLGAGYLVTGVGRFGFSDRNPNAELSVARSNLSTTIRLNGYTRLVSANDWGTPLTFTSSLAAFLFGRDEGFYYRATGAELNWTSERGARVDWRAFAERQRSAPQTTTRSLGASFIPNIDAAEISSVGVSARVLRSYGIDPRGFRAFTDFRLEAAGGDSTYGRSALDLTLTRGLAGRLTGALMLSGGTSVGHVPVQRRWFLGGTQTIRGQDPDTAQSGNAFWMTRIELARAYTGFRASLFGDLGWVGDRSKLSEVGRPLSGAGIGFSFLDGLIRFDVARGIYPQAQTRAAFYFGGRF